MGAVTTLSDRALRACR